MRRREKAELSVLDASAALAFLQGEPGGEAVRKTLVGGAAISAVNLAEVHSTLVEQEAAAEALIARLKAMGLEVEPFDEVDASVVGALRPRTRALGLSLADRACLALGLRLGRPILAADGALAAADVGVEVVLIR